MLLSESQIHRRRWREYRTDSGRRPVKEFIAALPEGDRVAIYAEMREIAVYGLSIARHIRADIYEARIMSDTKAFRILFAAEGRFGQILLSLEAFQKQTQRLPPAKLKLAERRLADWRKRGARSDT